ncbi:hypothetical protein [Parendozoicomonas sp. Alg238-R29]|nr:hypothetical protein [Parendozoicomonas sp. Alg238-R29]
MMRKMLVSELTAVFVGAVTVGVSGCSMVADQAQQQTLQQPQ